MKIKKQKELRLPRDTTKLWQIFEIDGVSKIKTIDPNFSLRDILEHFIENKRIEVPTIVGDHIKTSFSHDMIKAVLNEVLPTLDPPYMKITEEEMLEDFADLESMDALDLWVRKGDLYTKFKYQYKVGIYYITFTRRGNRSSNYFHQIERWNCESQFGVSPNDSLTDVRTRKNIIDSYLQMRMIKAISSSELKQLISISNYMAQQFKPSVAKALYTMFAPKNAWILDMSGGYGDRLSAFLSYCKGGKYFAIDPNVNVHRNYMKQIEAYGMHRDNQVNFILDGAENITLPENTIDFAFTSPPYFNKEVYAKDKSQAMNKFDSRWSWTKNFLIRMLRNAWVSLKDGGFLAVNISDIMDNNKLIKFCDRMNREIAKFPDAVFVDCIGMEIAKRFGAKKRSGMLVEPVWVWRKSSKGESFTIKTYAEMSASRLDDWI